MTKEEIKQKVSVIVSDTTTTGNEKRDRILNLFGVSNRRELLIAFVNEIMSNKEYHKLENIDIVEKYIKSNL